MEKRNFLKVLSILAVAFILVMGCANPVSPPSAPEATVSFDFSVAAVFDQTKSDSKGITETFTGTLKAVNLDTSVVQNFDWRVYIDKEAFTVTSSKKITLPPGRYSLNLDVANGAYQYSGGVLETDITEGASSINLTLQPVLGEITTSVDLNHMGYLFFKYPVQELSQIGDPKIGFSVDGSAEQIVTLNKTVDATEVNFGLTPGNHTVVLKFYDGNIQIGKSMPSQEAITVVEGQTNKMDIIPLEATTAFVLDLNTNIATFNLVIPGEIVDEVDGNISNLQTVFKVTGPLVGSYEQNVTLAPSGSDYAAQVLLSGFRFDTVHMTLVFTDIRNNEIISTCVSEATDLTSQNATISMSPGLLTRAVISGNLLALLDVNVFDQNGSPVPGASVYVDNVLKGITGTGAVEAAGYVKLYLIEGNRTVKAVSNGYAGTATVNLGILTLNSLDITLSTTDDNGTIGGDDNGTIGGDDNVTIPGSLSGLSSVQDFSGISANWESFDTVNGEQFIVHFPINGSTAKFYKHNGVQFNSYQDVPSGGYQIYKDLQKFNMNGETYVTITRYQTNVNRSFIDIYKVGETALEHFQQIVSQWSTGTVYYELNGEKYIVSGNSGGSSQVYKLIADHTGLEQFTQVETIPSSTITGGIVEFKLGVTQYLGMFTGGNRLMIFKHNGVQFEYLHDYSVPNAATNFKMFVMDGAYHFAFLEETSFQIRIVEYNNFTFTEKDVITTANDDTPKLFDVFTINGDTYLAASYYYNTTLNSYNRESKIYKYNGSAFSEVHSVATYGALEWEYFALGNTPYLILSNSTSTISIIYKMLFQ